MTEKNYTNDIKIAALALFISNSIFGIGIIEYPLGKPHRMFSYFYIASILSVYTVASIYSLPHFVEFGRYVAANQIIGKLFFASHVFFTISSLLLGWRRNEGLHSIIQRVLELEEPLTKIGIDSNYRELFKSQLRKIVMYIFGIWIYMSIINVILLYNKPVTIGKLMFLAVLNFPTIVQSVGDATFFNMLQYGNVKLQKINNLLRIKLTSTLDCPQHTNLLKYYNIPVNAQQYLTSNSFSTDTTNDELYIIRMARVGHLKVTILCETANQVFTAHILISIIVTIIMLTGCLYHSYALLTYENIRVINRGVFQIMGCIIIYKSIRIYLFATYCSDLTQQSADTGDIISEMYDENISEESRTEIRKFELQLIQRPVRIHAFYTIIMDYRFIQKTIHTITTYLVILTQCGNVTVELPEK